MKWKLYLQYQQARAVYGEWSDQGHAAWQRWKDCNEVCSDVSGCGCQVAGAAGVAGVGCGV